jgi:transcription elongation GreA/GreB family factor
MQDRGGKQQRVTLRTKLPGLPPLVAVADEQDLTRALAEANRELIRQIDRHKSEREPMDSRRLRSETIRHPRSGRPMSVSEEQSAEFSDEERDRIAGELAQLRQRRDRLAAGFEGDQDTVGDHGDAADAIQRADEVAVIDKKISQLNWQLRAGVPVAQPPGRLLDGTELTLRFPAAGVVHMRVVAVVEETPSGEEGTTLTADSPLGLALVGHQPGDTVTYSTPQRREQVELLDVKYPYLP